MRGKCYRSSHWNSKTHETGTQLNATGVSAQAEHGFQSVGRVRLHHAGRRRRQALKLFFPALSRARPVTIHMCGWGKDRVGWGVDPSDRLRAGGGKWECHAISTPSKLLHTWQRMTQMTHNDPPSKIRSLGHHFMRRPAQYLHQKTLSGARNAGHVMGNETGTTARRIATARDA
jgi:hypothetical protein